MFRYHGGWLAPNIYFLGHAGCVQVNGVRIAGASGIFNANHFRQGESCALVRYTIQFLISFVCDRTLGDDALRQWFDEKHLSYTGIQHSPTIPCA